MKHIIKYLLVMASILVVLPMSCKKDQWDEHNKASESGVGRSLLEIIQENPNWSKFYDALVKSGYDKILSESNNFTVFVPENSAWEGVGVKNGTTAKEIVSSHIAYEKYLSTNKSLYEPLQMLSTKVVRYKDDMFNGAKITSADHVANNGVLHAVDKIMQINRNIWEYLTYVDAGYLQIEYIKSRNRKVMDVAKSIELGVNEIGQPVYDTVWMNVNNFLKAVPLDSESQNLTYIVMQDDGYEALYNKYLPYFQQSTTEESESLTNFNVCQDFAFEGIIDIAEFDTLTNIFGVKVPIKGVDILGSFDASNGRVYFIDKSSILLREKIKPVIIEGEDFKKSADDGFVFKRYRPNWASGQFDINLSCSTKQADTIWVVDQNGLPIHTVITGRDSFRVESKTFTTPNGADASRANINNFWIEYKANVNSAPYEIYYVAYDDVSSDYSDPNHVMRLEQKLFVSLPNMPTLKKGNTASTDAVTNGHMGDTICFVGVDLAGVHKLTKLEIWSLDAKTQYIKKKLNVTHDISVPFTGELTMWLCNTTRSNVTRLQGIMFLDYIKLVPLLPDE